MKSSSRGPSSRSEGFKARYPKRDQAKETAGPRAVKLRGVTRDTSAWRLYLSKRIRCRSMVKLPL
jgi:hypothetical protein